MHHRSYALRRRHALLEFLIADERKRPAPDPFKLQSLKREKLWVKERMSSLAPASHVHG